MMIMGSGSIVFSFVRKQSAASAREIRLQGPDRTDLKKLKCLSKRVK